MVSLNGLRQQIGTSASVPTYICTYPLNLYKSPQIESLVTQAAAGRYLEPIEIPDLPAEPTAIRMKLVEDDYPGWVALEDLGVLELAHQPYIPPVLSRAQIEQRLPSVIRFTQAAMARPNQYLWGGTVGGDYDCSGLMQTAFAANGIRLPRDSYQQEAFCQPIALAELAPGDLIFFGTPERTTHVALYLGDGNYIHSSGKDQGRNGIGIDSLVDLSHPVSRAYRQQLRGAGRVMASYAPQQLMA